MKTKKVHYRQNADKPTVSPALRLLYIEPVIGSGITIYRSVCPWCGQRYEVAAASMFKCKDPECTYAEPLREGACMACGVGIIFEAVTT